MPQLVIDKAFQLGMRRSRRPHKNSAFLEILAGAMASEEGLVLPAVLTNPFPDTAIEWPWPQLVRLSAKTLLLWPYQIDIVTEGTPWTIQEHDLWGTGESIFFPSIPLLSDEPLTDSKWHVMDFGETYCLFGTDYVVVKKPDQAKFQVFSNPVIKTGCNVNGRPVWGNFSGWGDWADVFEGLIPAQYALLANSMQLGKNTVAWGAIGTDDLTAWWDAGNTAFLDNLASNMAGFLNMPWQDEVLVVKGLGDKVMVYGERNTAALVPIGEPPAYSVQFILPGIGAFNRSSVTGTNNVHVWADQNGQLHSIDSSLEHKIIIERDISEISGDSVVASYSDKEHVAIFSGDYGTLFASLKYASMYADDYITSCAGDFVISESHFALGFITSVFDMGTRGIKTITSVRLAIDDPENWTIILMSRADCAGEFVQPDEYPVLDSSGTLNEQVSGIEFQLLILFIGEEAPESISLDRIDIEYRLGGKIALENVLEA